MRRISELGMRIGQAGVWRQGGLPGRFDQARNAAALVWPMFALIDPITAGGADDRRAAFTR